MRISIVTLSYNQGAFLQEAMDSVLQQNHSDLEYIVVDPGSTDGSRELLRSYGEQISRFIFEPDRGAADGLNRGFGGATGEIFGFLNADDFLLPGALHRVSEFFESHPQCDIAHGKRKCCGRPRPDSAPCEGQRFHGAALSLWRDTLASTVYILPARGIPALAGFQRRE